MSFLGDYFIQNNEIKEEKFNIPIKYKNNEIKFKCKEEEFILYLEKEIITMIKENKESKFTFVFNKNKETKGKIFIKEINNTIETLIKTNKLNINKNKATIDYDLFISSEFMGNFKFELNIWEEKND